MKSLSISPPLSLSACVSPSVCLCLWEASCHVSRPRDGPRERPAQQPLRVCGLGPTPRRRALREAETHTRSVCGDTAAANSPVASAWGSPSRSLQLSCSWHPDRPKPRDGLRSLKPLSCHTAAGDDTEAPLPSRGRAADRSWSGGAIGPVLAPGAPRQECREEARCRARGGGENGSHCTAPWTVGGTTPGRTDGRAERKKTYGLQGSPGGGGSILGKGDRRGAGRVWEKVGNCVVAARRRRSHPAGREGRVGSWSRGLSVLLAKAVRVTAVL